MNTRKKDVFKMFFFHYLPQAIFSADKIFFIQPNIYLNDFSILI